MAETVYKPEITAEICQRISNGEPLEAICRDDHMPHADTVHRWITEEKIKGFSQDFARARERGYDSIAEQARLVAKGALNYSSGDVMRDRLIIETDLKLLAKWSKRYADKQQIELTGKDGEPLSMRLIEAQQRLLKDITPQQKVIDHIAPLMLDDLI